MKLTETTTKIYC